jgi:hypothetical protein
VAPTKYSEGDGTRIIALIANGDGTFSVAQDDSLDPFATLVRRFGIATTPGVATLTSSGATTIHTPTSGQAIRLKWIALSTPKGQNDAVCTIKIGTTEHYKWSLSSPGAFMRTSIREGAVNETLTATLDVAATVYVNYELENFVPVS